MGVFEKLKDKIKNLSEDEIFLDTISRKNAVREPKDFRSSDVKMLKSLLDVSRFTMWMKSSKEQSELQKSYKNFYKEVSKSLSSLYKNCVMIEKYYTNKLDTDILSCINLKIDLERKIKILEDFEKLTLPSNIVKSIDKINKITDKFNKLRTSEEYRSLLINAGFNFHISNYTEFEKMTRMRYRTRSPMIKINEFVEEKKQLKEKETRAIFLYLIKEDKGDIKSAKVSVFNLLDNLASSVDLPKGSLEKYLLEKNDYFEINKNLYDEVVNALAKKIKAECEKSDEFKNEVSKSSEEEFKKNVRSKMDGFLNKIAKENEQRVNKQNRGFWESLYMVPVDAAVSLSEYFFNGFKDMLFSKNSNVENEKSRKLNVEIKNKVEEFCETWIKFEMAHRSLANMIKYRNQKKENLNNFIKDYEKYIKDISEASDISKNDAMSGMNAFKAKYDPEKDGLEVSYQEKIAQINKKSDEINKVVSKLKVEYDSAVNNSKIIKKIIKNFVGSYKKQFENALDGATLSKWNPPSPCSKLTLGQSVLFVYYSVDRYEKNWHFGLSDYAVNYLYKSEKTKLGITINEIKNTIDPSRKQKKI